MSARKLIWFGAFVALIGALGAIVTGGASSAIVAFAGGALFGKGYGLWETRQTAR